MTPFRELPACDHGVTFDEKEARTLEAHEIRRRWPRFSGTCQQCGFTGIYYANLLHYVAGDW